jgi:hypothetical protein
VAYDGAQAIAEVNATDKRVRDGTFTDKSAAITPAATDFVLMAATTVPRKKGSFIENPDVEDEPIYYNIGSAAAAIPVKVTSANSRAIYPGSSVDLEGTYGAVHVIATTNNHRVVAKERI